MHTRTLKEQAETMHKTKLSAVASSSDCNEPVEPSRRSEDMDESLQLPWLSDKIVIQHPSQQHRHALPYIGCGANS